MSKRDAKSQAIYDAISEQWAIWFANDAYSLADNIKLEIGETVHAWLDENRGAILDIVAEMVLKSHAADARK